MANYKIKKWIWKAGSGYAGSAEARFSNREKKKNATPSVFGVASFFFLLGPVLGLSLEGV